MDPLCNSELSKIVTECTCSEDWVLSTEKLAELQKLIHHNEISCLYCHGAESILLWGLLKVVKGDSFVNISIFISLNGFSLSDLVGKISFQRWNVFTYGFYCYLVYSFYLIHVLVHLWMETWCSGFSIHFLTTIFVGDYVSSNDMGNFFTNHFNILNYTIQMVWQLLHSSWILHVTCFDLIFCGEAICIWN